MTHPWKCKRGHENRTPIPPEMEKGARRALVLWCSEPGCVEHTSVFVGETHGTQPHRKRKQRRVRRSAAD
ncbi:MAG TPA: hypothetical protein VKG23_17465 [Thermoanaerobaculia bacterium]|nr:hypothetical protein [Thermoanaerobaculia bacterium]